MDGDPLEAQLGSHLAELEQDPNHPIDERLFDSSLSFLAVQLAQKPQKLTEIIVRLSGLLLKLQQDPSPVVRLLSKLVEPLTFADVLSLKPPVDFVNGLSRGALPINLLVLKILRKAAGSAQDAAILAGIPGVVHALVKLWLSTPDMGVYDLASNVLVDLLKVDKENGTVAVHGVGDVALQSGGQGLIWRRLFGDKDVYGLLYSIPNLRNDDSGLSKGEKTVSQARLLSILPQIGVLDWDYLIRSHHSELESQYELRAGEGLMHYACNHLIDYKDDILLHMSLIQFFSDLISTVTIPSPLNTDISLSLEFLLQHKLHDHAVSYWLRLDPTHDPVDQSFLLGPSAHYLSTYTTNYPDRFLTSGRFIGSVLHRLRHDFQISPNQWAHGELPKHSLHVLSSIPNGALLHFPDQDAPLFLVPTRVTNEDALNTLAHILGGPRQPTPTMSIGTLSEFGGQVGANLLYALYLKYHPTMFTDLITHADTVALPEKALAALHLLKSLINPSWNAVRPDPEPAADQPRSAYIDLATQPRNGVDVLLRQPARDVVLPYILAPPRQFANLVGGRGDTESAAYRIAVARYELVLAAQRELRNHVPSIGSGEDVGLEAVRAAVNERASKGVWGGSQGEIGGRIATLEL